MKRLFTVMAVTVIAAAVAFPFGGSVAEDLGGLYVPAAASVAAEKTSGDYEYTTLDDGTVEISGYNGTGGSVTIPGSIDGKKVTSIGYGAFKDSEISSVTIPDSVTVICEEAFSWSSLSTVRLPEDLKEIRPWAFKNTPVTGIEIP